MTCLTCQKILVLVIVMMVTGGVHSGPRKIVRRQTSSTSVDTSGLSDFELLACFNPAEDCMTNIDNVNEIQVEPVVEATGCTCVKQEKCKDKPSQAQIGGNLVNVVNVRTSCIDPFQTCCINVIEEVTPSPPTSAHVPQCGQLNKQGVDSVFLGFKENQAQYGQFPWMAAVMTNEIPGTEGANVYLCGASLIHPSVVLTAAHYVNEKKAQELSVRLGEWNFKFPTEPILHQDIRVQRILIHPNFSPNQLTYDVALLFLEQNAVLGPTVDTVCLPSPHEVFDGNTCYSSGWGKDQFGQSGKYSEILKSLTLPAVNHQQCQNAYRSTRLGTSFNLHKSFVCAGGEAGIDTCSGDGGSPLVCPMKTDPSRYVQAGVVAWGIGCGEDGIPGVYASISEAVDWIGQQLLTNMQFDIRTQVNVRGGQIPNKK